MPANYRISRKDRRLFSTQIPMLKLGYDGLSRCTVHANPRFNCFGLQTSSLVSLTQQSLKRVGQKGVNNA